MSLNVSCSGCGQEYRVKDELIGKKIRCKECGTLIAVPSETADDDFADEATEEIADPLPTPSRKKAAPKPVKKKRASSSGGMSTGMKVVLALLAGGAVLGLVCCGGVFWVGSTAWKQLTAGVEIPAGQSFEQYRTSFRTKLLHAGPSEQEYDIETPPANVTEVMYPSGPLPLKAWVYRPPGVEEPRPALVFFHGGFAFGSGDLEACQPFMDAGYVVMAPMLRGENGNPGNFELFLGEIDDARAACRWIAQQPYVDKTRIYTFGHSVGGGVSAVLSLMDDVPVRHGGSSGGLYDHTTFLGWSAAGMVPFENTPQERTARLLVGNARLMQRPHYGYYGSEDEPFHSTAAALRKESTNGKLTLEEVPGDHFTSFDESLRRYLQITQKDAGR
jgi:dienelactone hydrolase